MPNVDSAQQVDRAQSLSHEYRVIVAERDRLRRQLDDLDERLFQVVIAWAQPTDDPATESELVNKLVDRLFAVEDLISVMRLDGRLGHEDACQLLDALGVVTS
jgi:cob(I)alamin adenosyltransferase